MIILRNNSHGGIIRVCMGIFTTALRNKTIRQILKENISPYFQSVSLVIWPLTLMERTHFSELSISRFSTYMDFSYVRRKPRNWNEKMRSFHQLKCKMRSAWHSGHRNFSCLWFSIACLCKHSQQNVWRHDMVLGSV